MSVEWRQTRIARNETSFRDINERLEADLRHVRHTPELLEFVCECGDRRCDQLVRLTFDEYEEVRQDSRHFAVVLGHVYPEAERVIAGNERFEIVEKLGHAVEVTDAEDDRAPGDGGLRSDRTPPI